MSDPNGWPDEARPGVPMNSEVSGWHWVGEAADPIALFWKAVPHLLDGGVWLSGSRAIRSVWTYLGPCLQPAEVAARVEQARAKALEEAAAVARRVEIPGECSPAEAHGRMTGALAAAEAIRALTEKQATREGGG